MKIDIIIPAVGESVTEATLVQWLKPDGDAVAKEDPLFVMETDKITQEVTAQAGGILSILVSEGETVPVGAVVGKIVSGNTAQVSGAENTAPSPPPAELDPELDLADQFPSVRRLLSRHRIRPDQVTGTGPGGRLTKGDIILFLESGAHDSPVPEPDGAGDASSPEPEETQRRVPMSPIRKRIAERLLEARRNTAMLTTFNDIDMSRAMEIRKRYKDRFADKYGVNLGFMSFFVKAAVAALREIPAINAFIQGDDIVYHDHQHIGVAVGSSRGLVVPVLRFAGKMSFADVENGIAAMVDRIQNNRLALADLEGGTFTISNGGVYGSLLSTPILNTPQSGILGMHKIEKRPVVVDDEIVIRPMMYVALSYDHRIVDGREAVTFLKRIKECVERPERMLMEV